MKTITNLITAIILLCTLNIFAQPKPFDYKNARENHNKLMSDTKSEEAEHYREYVEKYKDADLPINDDGWSWEQIFYYYRINLDALDEFKALGIDLVKLGNDEYRAFSEINYLDKALFSNIIFIGEAIDSCAVDIGYRTKFTVKVTEVLKGKKYYKNFPDTINLYFADHPSREDIEKDLNSPKASEEFKIFLRNIIKRSSNGKLSGITSIKGPGDMGVKLGKKCLIYLEYSFLPKSVTGSDETNNYHPSWNFWFNDMKNLFYSTSNKVDNLTSLKNKIKKITELNKPEFNHQSRGK